MSDADYLMIVLHFFVFFSVMYVGTQLSKIRFGNSPTLVNSEGRESDPGKLKQEWVEFFMSQRAYIRLNTINRYNS